MFASRQALEAIDCSLLGDACSRLLAVEALVGLVDKCSLFLQGTGTLVKFAFGSGDGNFFLYWVGEWCDYQ